MTPIVTDTLPPIKVYECGKCRRTDFKGIQALWAHFETCGDPLPEPVFADWDMY